MTSTSDPIVARPGFWLRIAGGWLLLAGLVHLGTHYWSIVLENGSVGLRDLAMTAMRQSRSPDPLTPSMWREFRLYSATVGLLHLFAGSVSLVLAAHGTPLATARRYALTATVFWTAYFLLCVFVNPVIQPLVASAVAVPLHGTAFLAASYAEAAAAARRESTTASTASTSDSSL